MRVVEDHSVNHCLTMRYQMTQAMSYMAQSYIWVDET